MHMKALVSAISAYDPEARKALEFIARAGSTDKLEILDVGCGYGRFLKLLSDQGYRVTGVETNPHVVAANRAAGLKCLSTDEFKTDSRQYDVILMSHIIEHFSPEALLAFMDSYLDRLKPGGKLVICTPLMSPYFYDDFDHVKPYQPSGILMFFGAGDAQVQRYARNRLALEDLWFRRSSYRLSYRRGLYVRTPITKLLRIADLVGALAYRFSGGCIGRIDGWVGLFRKENMR